MKRASLATMAAFFAASFFLAACGRGKADPKAEAPPTPTVEHEQDLNVVQVNHPEQFPLATAVAYEATSQLNATGTISPDISRSVPVISIATGRVVEIKARLGDTVKKGQLLLRVQSADVSAAFSDYRKAPRPFPTIERRSPTKSSHEYNSTAPSCSTTRALSL